MINVTKTGLPPLEEYVAHLRGIWERGWITNNGDLLQELEARLKDEFGVPFLHFVTNGTLALQISLKALNIRGKVITTPFSYVATLSALLWEGCEPVFVDIEPHTFCIDAAKIEDAITPDTEAILATHVYGFPCAVNQIAEIAAKHKLRVIYDAAHAFGVKWNGESLLVHGDMAVLSTHATKLFHTIEGGLIVSHDANLARTVDLMRSFGHNGDDHYLCGINAKASEFQAAMGLCMLPRTAGFISARRTISEQYDRRFSGSSLERPPLQENLEYNYSYYPIILPSEESLLEVQSALNTAGIETRRYFYPSLNLLPYVQGNRCPVSEDLALRILCIPIYPELDTSMVDKIADLILGALGK